MLEVELPPERDTPALQENPAPAAPAATPAERIAELNSFAAKAHQDLERYHERLRALVPKAGAPPAPAAQDEIAAIRASVQSIPQQSQKALAEVDQIRPTVQSGELLKALDSVQETIRDISAKLGPVRRALSQLPDKPPASQVQAQAGTPETAAVLVEGTVIHAVSLPEGRSALQTELSAIGDKVSAYFQSARKSLAVYSKDARASLPISALERSVRAREAETLYRFGKREEARRVWSGLAAEDALDYRLLRNIAVCDSLGPDLRRPLRSWQAYAETLYFHAAAAGDTSRLASERAAFHRDFGAAYGPAGFCAWDRKNTDAAHAVRPSCSA